jgi:hypothetical protein
MPSDLGRSVATEFDRADRADPLPSWDELAARVGIDAPMAVPGDLLEMSVDVQAYWPAVRSLWGRSDV